MKIYLLIMIVNHFPKIVKDILKRLPKNDYPVLNSRLFVECWLAYVLDNSLTSMRDLFKRINPAQDLTLIFQPFPKLTLIEVKNHSEKFMSN